MAPYAREKFFVLGGQHSVRALKDVAEELLGAGKVVPWACQVALWNIVLSITTTPGAVPHCRKGASARPAGHTGTALIIPPFLADFCGFCKVGKTPLKSPPRLKKGGLLRNLQDGSHKNLGP